MSARELLKDLWENQEIPDYLGVFHESGDFYEFEDHQLKKIPLVVHEDSEPEPVTIFDRCFIYNKRLEVLCGEGLGFGSNGFVLLLNTETNTPVWSFFSGWSNPFNTLINTGSYIVAVSTTGSVLRFKVSTIEQPFQEMFLSVT